MRSLLFSFLMTVAASTPFPARSGTTADQYAASVPWISACYAFMPCVAHSAPSSPLIASPARLVIPLSFAHKAGSIPSVLRDPDTRMAKIRRPSSEPSLKGLSCDEDAFGLYWAMCHNESLQDLSARIEARLLDFRHKLGAETGDALLTDWRQFIDELNLELGARWLDFLAEDVSADFRRYLTFLTLVHRRDGVDGPWGNHGATLHISTEGGRHIVDVQSPSCEFSLSQSAPDMFERVGDGLRLTVPRAVLENEYPAMTGCFRSGEEASVVDGVYFALIARPD